MKISFEKKIFLGFVINVLVVIAAGLIFISRLDIKRDKTMDSVLEWIELSLLILSIILLVIVYFIIKSQLKAKNQSQNLLLENKQLLQSIIDNTTNPIFVKKINGEYLLINKQCESLFKITNEQIIGKTDHDFLPKKIADVYRSSDLEVVKQLKELKTEETIELSDGNHTYIAVKFPLYDSNGRIYAIGGISTDITDRKKLEISLKTSDKFFNMSLDIMVIASNDKFIKINPTMSKLLGYSSEELLNQPFISFVEPEDILITQKEIDKLKTGALTSQFENRWICKDGSVKWFEWSASTDLATGLLYAIARDVTEAKENEKSLIFADNFFMMSYDMLIVGKGDYFIKVNPAFTKTLGYEQKDMNNKTFLSFTHPDDIKASVDAIKKLQKGVSLLNHRARARCKDGSYKWLDWTSTYDVRTDMMYTVARDVTKLVENEKSLKMANTFFNMSFDMLVVGKEDHFIKVNPAFSKTMGYSQKEMDALSFYELTGNVEQAKDVVSKLLKGESMVNWIDLSRRKDGSKIWLNWNTTVDIKTGIMYGVARDITQKVIDDEKLKNYTQKLKEDEQQLQTFFDGAPDPIIIIDSQSKILRWNTKAESIFGWKDTEVIGKPIYEYIIPSRYRATHKKEMKKYMTEGISPIINKSTEMEAINKKGVEFPVSISVSPVKMGEKIFFIGFLRDITDNKQIINDLYENEEKLRLIIDNISEGVIVANSDKQIIMANYMANEIFGIEENNSIPVNLTDQFELYFPDEKTIFPSQHLPMARALEGEETNDIDVVLWNPISKEKKRVLISGRPLIDQNEKVVAAVVTIRDISEYKKLEEELKETESKYRKLIGFKKGDDKNE
ncbi:PAS domain-containing protein [Flavobacterium sp. K5-23]|uniref:PAS domain-containing protein n=1 Tax=Flavobacterium sp. K5-23 TaxID=2746225 RepID=UPI00200BA33B|nr:PAS domain-containing protein [Flavobacterium sp. K5-23]UQD56379.1 PAS domain S-box protein [Flavobacterium sp. K5-23]